MGAVWGKRGELFEGWEELLYRVRYFAKKVAFCNQVGIYDDAIGNWHLQQCALEQVEKALEH